MHSEKLGPLVEGGVNLYITNSLHFCVLYFVLFGVLPKFVFAKMNLANTGAEDYFYLGDKEHDVNGSYEAVRICKVDYREWRY